MAADHKTIDPVSGVATTGHVWDGITELNTPLPRWWLWLFYICIIWAVGYWLVYPTWPLVANYTKGYFGWQSRDAIVTDMAALKAQRAGNVDRIAKASLAEIVATPELLTFAQAQGRAAFGDNCAACHGAGGAGAKGYPNLNDDDWLHGGKLEDIFQTIRYGVRSGHAESRMPATMPSFGRDGTLTRADIVTVAEYVRSLSKLAVDPKADLAKGAAIFAENCALCHGEAAKGNRELGAPNLTDGIWLYGSDRDTIVEGLWNGRGAIMPAWTDRLEETTIKSLAVYVHTLGGGEK